MKIVAAIKSTKIAGGGAERVFASVVNGLSAAGHDVSIITFDKNVGDDFYPINQNIQKIYLGRGDVHKKSGCFEMIQKSMSLRRAILREQPDVVLAFMHSMFVPINLALFGTGIKVIASEHNIQAYYKDRPFEYILVIWAMMLSWRVTVITQNIKNTFPKIISRNKIRVIGNPVEDTGGKNEEKKSEKIIFCAGRLDAAKDHQILIAAFARLADKFPDWRLVLAGDGPMKLALNKKIEELGLSERVLMLGYIKDMANVYARAGLFVLPSKYESFGLVVAEAMQHRVPVVAFADCVGIDHLIIHDKNGYLVDQRDPVSLAAAIELIITTPERCERYVRAGMETIAQFAPRRIDEQWRMLVGRE